MDAETIMAGIDAACLMRDIRALGQDIPLDLLNLAIDVHRRARDEPAKHNVSARADMARLMTRLEALARGEGGRLPEGGDWAAAVREWKASRDAWGN